MAPVISVALLWEKTKSLHSSPEKSNKLKVRDFLQNNQYSCFKVAIHEQGKIGEFLQTGGTKKTEQLNKCRILHRILEQKGSIC
jgi:hypothetical protein